MKLLLISISFFVMQFAFAQEHEKSVLSQPKSVDKKELKVVEYKKPIQIDSSSPSKKSTSNEYTYKVNEEKLATKKRPNSKTIAYYNSRIQTLESKKLHIQSDSIENQKALESKWYEFIDEEILKAKIEKSKLEKTPGNHE